jgi:NAD(P)-dependent dehydrogenase (short-subunit alcohol dehydrogenase family)
VVAEQVSLKDAVAVVAGASRGCGRGIALAADPERLAKTGQLLYVADLAAEYGFTDVDGTRVGNFYRVLGLIP